MNDTARQAGKFQLLIKQRLCPRLEHGMDCCGCSKHDMLAERSEHNPLDAHAGKVSTATEIVDNLSCLRLMAIVDCTNIAVYAVNSTGYFVVLYHERHNARRPARNQQNAQETKANANSVSGCTPAEPAHAKDTG